MLLLLFVSVFTLLFGVAVPNCGSASRAIIPVYIAIAAAWLTFCLQRRVAYTNALRALWEKTSETVHASLRLARADERSDKDCRDVLEKIGCRIDEVRGVFRNVSEVYRPPTASAKRYVRDVKHAETMSGVSAVTESYRDDGIDTRGLYPFESLKQIYNVVDRLRISAPKDKRAGAIACDTIEHLWRILRSELLKELDRDYPQFPDTPYSSPTRISRLRAKLFR